MLLIPVDVDSDSGNVDTQFGAHGHWPGLGVLRQAAICIASSLPAIPFLLSDGVFDPRLERCLACGDGFGAGSLWWTSIKFPAQTPHMLL